MGCSRFRHLEIHRGLISYLQSHTQSDVNFSVFVRHSSFSGGDQGIKTHIL